MRHGLNILSSVCGAGALDFSEWPIVFQALVVGHFALFVSTSLVLEGPSPAGGWMFVLWNGRLRQPDGFSFSVSTTAISGNRMDFGSLVVQL